MLYASSYKSLHIYLQRFRADCGDVSDLVDNSLGPAPESDCDIACSGDPIHLCGGAERLSVYEWVGEPLNVWHTPEVTGAYEVRVLRSRSALAYSISFDPFF